MPRTINVKMARASDADCDAVRNFMQFIDEWMEYGTFTENAGTEPATSVYLTESEFQEKLKDLWENAVNRSYGRVVHGHQILRDNCTDPTCDVLEFRREIRDALAVFGAVEQDAFGCIANTMLTRDGTYLDLADPKQSQIEFNSIATGLSRECRFGRQCEPFYSVAEHCVLGAERIDSWEGKLAFLLHDAHEAYMGDMPKPLKNMLPGYSVIANRLQSVINARFGVQEGWEDKIREIDRLMLVSEKSQLFPNDGHTWPGFGDFKQEDLVRILCWDPEDARVAFSLALSRAIEKAGVRS